MIKTPPARLANEPCRARPIAKPAAPIAATREALSTPNCVITNTNKMIFNPQLAALTVNFSRVGS